MSEIKTAAMVLGTVDYGEQDRLLTLFSPALGRIDAKAKACRKAASPLLACAQPLIYGDFVLFRMKDKTGVKQAEVLESFYPLREEPYRFAAAGLCAALCRNTVQEEEENEALFALLYRTCSYLAYGENGVRDILSAFFAHFLTLTGYQPAITRCALCGRLLTQEKLLHFSPALGGALCGTCGLTEPRVSATVLEAVRRILLLSPDALERVRLKEPLSGEVFSLLLAFTLHCIPAARKSAALLLELPE